METNGEVDTAHAPVGAEAAGPLLGREIRGLRFDEVIGAGGMGHVFRAEQVALERTVAVKVLHRRLVADDDARTRFMLEGRAASRLEHPHVVAIHDLDELDDGRPYLVMEFLRGHSLAGVLAREGSLPLARALRVTGQVLSALAAGHALGIVHRDVKPENVVLEAMRSGGDHAKLVDFGLALWRGRSKAEHDEDFCGTPEYASPEAVRGEPVDERTDLYSTGVMLFELLVGCRPFQASTPALTGLRHLTDPAPRLADAHPEAAFPDAVEAIVARALAKRPADRYASALEMGRDVAEALEKLGGAAPATLSPSTWDAVTCAACKSPNARRQRHCGHCGHRLAQDADPPSPSTPGPPRIEPPRTFADASPSLRRHSALPTLFMGRDAELRLLQEALAEAALGAVVRRVVGAVGSGRSALVARLLEKAELLGAKVVRVAPDAFMGRVPFFAATRLVDRLQPIGSLPADVGAEDRRALARDLASREVVALARGVVRLLHAAVDAESTAAPLVLAVDDFDAIDGPSRLVLERVIEACPDVPMLVVVVHRSGASVGATMAAPAIDVGAFSVEEARACARALGVEHAASEPLTPLHLEQIVRFAFEAPGRIPPRSLGDLLHARLSLLGRDTRRVLEFLAAVPGGADDALLVAQNLDIQGLSARVATLRDLGFVVSGGFGHRVAHPLFAAICLGTMTLDARRRLYAQSFAVLAERGAPPEALAARAEEAGQPLRAMAVLERAGVERERRGEREAAFDAFSRAIGIARREMVRAEFEQAEAVFVGLALRVARFLIDSGDFAAGSGLLDEAAGLALERPRDRVLVLAERAHLEAERRNFDSATALLREAAAVAHEAGDGGIIRRLVDLEASLRRAAGKGPGLTLPPGSG